MLSIKRPTLVLNSDICRNNIRAMAARARAGKVIFRPHFKTHQSAAIAEWFRDEGVTAIAVSSVSMARYFAKNHWMDITIAFPVNLAETDEINELASGLNLSLLVESAETAAFLVKHLQYNCGYFIKIDTGYHRTGVNPGSIPLIDSIINTTESSKLSFRGFLTHSGQAYHAHQKEELLRIQQSAAGSMLKLKKHYHNRFPELILSVGDTPTCSQLPAIEGIDEIRPGNFVFYDVMQFGLGSCRLDDIATALICPVVAMHPGRMEAVIYGGAVHLSKESTPLLPDPQAMYGLTVSWDGKTWDTSELLGRVSSLSQEHGIVALTQAGCNLKPGSLVAILPVHSCLTAHLMRTYYDLQGTEIHTMNS